MRATRQKTLAAVTAMLLVLFASVTPDARAAGELSAQQEDQVRGLIREHILQNPEIIFEALEILKTRQEQAENERIAAALGTVKSRLNSDPMIPIGGNPNGDITVVEFFDYNCPYCRRAAAALQDVETEDKNIRIQFVEFPVLGEASVFAARAGLAAAKQNKYEQFHFALMTAQSKVNQDSVLDHARQVGLDIDQLQKDMKADEISAALDRNQALAAELGIRGTPAFIIGNQLAPGAIPAEQIQAMVAAARKQQ